MDDETASTCSSRSRQSEMQVSKSRVSTPLSSIGGSISGKNVVNCVSRSGLGIADGDESYADLEFPADDLTCSMQNPLLLLSAAATQLNPRQFELPKDVMCPVTFPGLWWICSISSAMI